MRRSIVCQECGLFIINLPINGRTSNQRLCPYRFAEEIKSGIMRFSQRRKKERFNVNYVPAKDRFSHPKPQRERYSREDLPRFGRIPRMDTLIWPALRYGFADKSIPPCHRGLRPRTHQQLRSGEENEWPRVVRPLEATSSSIVWRVDDCTIESSLQPPRTHCWRSSLLVVLCLRRPPK
jgi:hypothetical protein